MITDTTVSQLRQRMIEDMAAWAINPISAGISVLPSPQRAAGLSPHHGRSLAGHALDQTPGRGLTPAAGPRTRARSAGNSATSRKAEGFPRTSR